MRAVLVKLKYISDWTDKRRINAKLYNNFLSDSDVIIRGEMSYAKHVYYVYCVRLKNRDEIREKLKVNNITTGIHYPIPLHLQPAYKKLKFKKGDFPVTEKVSEEILSLPVYPELTEDKIKFVSELIKDYY